MTTTDEQMTQTSRMTLQNRGYASIVLKISGQFIARTARVIVSHDRGETYRPVSLKDQATGMRLEAPVDLPGCYRLDTDGHDITDVQVIVESGLDAMGAMTVQVLGMSE